VIAAGYPTGVYCNQDYYKNKYTQDTLKRYQIWLCDIDGHSAPKYPCAVWQYSWNCKLPGSGKEFDMDYLMEDEKTDMTENEAIDKVIALAKEEIGYLEKASNADLYSKTGNAGSGNYTKYGKEMHAIAPLVMDYPAAWCDAFVDWLFYKAFGVEKAKAMLCGDFDDYTVFSADFYKKAGRWFSAGRRGDQIFFKNSGGICHTGIVTKVQNGKVYTIEGNKSNAVRACEYSITDPYIAGYGRPLYTAEAKKEETTGGKYMFTVDTVKLGSQGKSVTLMQRLLRARGYKGQDGKALDLDGSAGVNSIYALKAYQKREKLTADGVCGANTWKKLLGL
jgi:hypothetical protein